MKIIPKVKLWFRLLFHGLMFGIRGADTEIIDQTSGDGAEVNHKLEISGNVFQEMLNEQVTQQVEETRDATYRVYRKANNYDVHVTGMGTDGENLDNEDSELRATATKKVTPDQPRVDLAETSGYKIVLVQDAKEYENETEKRNIEAETGKAIDDRSNLIFTVTYKDGLIPRFYIERHIRRLALKKNKSGEYILDLYFSAYPRQFVKPDRAFISELVRIYDNRGCKSDILEVDKITFVTDKAFGCDDLHKITIGVGDLRDITNNDGSFILEFNCTKDDEDIVEKYRTESLDEKYKKKAPKKQATDINALVRKLEEDDNKETNIIKLK